MGPGTLKCITALSRSRSLRGLVEEALRARVPAGDIRHLYGEVLLVSTDAEAAAIRNWLIPCLEDGGSVFVVEFGRWSGYGPALDRRWLLGRGH